MRRLAAIAFGLAIFAGCTKESSEDKTDGAGAVSGKDGAADSPGAGQTDAGVDAVSNPADAPKPADAAPTEAALPSRVLLYHFSTLDISSVPAQLAFLKKKLEEWKYTVDESQDPAVFTDATLTKYAMVAMVNTCFAPFGAGKPDRPASEALQRFLKNGGGLFGTHCASVTFQDVNPPPLYNELIGGRGANGYFDGESSCRKIGDHPTVAALPATFKFVGNLDNTDFIAASTTVVVKCTWGPPDMKDVAVSWYRSEGRGRVFYSNFAKVDGDLNDATLGGKHLVPALAWVLGR